MPAPQIVKINVTAIDNEVYILVSTPAGSSEICHLKSGWNKPVSTVVIPQAILATGPYTLTAVLINWGGPSALNVILTDSSGNNTTITAPTNLPTGGTWSQAVAITV